MPDFTVVIPARNEERFLPTTLRALAKQSLRPAQVIVVDHLSTDRTAEVAHAAGARVLFCDGNGVADARQMGLEAARTNWIATTDADCAPHMYWLSYLSAASEGRVGLYGPMKFSGVRQIYSDGSGVAYRLFLQACRAAGQPNFAGGNMAFSRSAALLVGGYPLTEAAEDVTLGRKLAQFGRVGYVSGAWVQTSARRLRGGFVPFMIRQAKNMIGQTKGYFDEARATQWLETDTRNMHTPAPTSFESLDQ